MPIIDEDEFIAHFGTKRHSGRYPWGSGADAYQRYSGFLQSVADLRAEGMSQVDIARSFSTDDYNFTTADLRQMTTIAKAYTVAEERYRAQRLKDEGNSNVAIGKLMGLPEATVRDRLKPAEESKQQVLVNTAEALKQNMTDSGGFLDIGRGTSNHLGVSPEKLASSVAMLREEGYEVSWYRAPTTSGKETTTKVLIPPGKTFADVVKDPSQIKTMAVYSEDGGHSFIQVKPPVKVDPKRVSVRYAEDGGDQKDGVIELRRGVPDLSLGDSRYAQVRIKVGDNHYLKGMAMYSDDIPDGVDMVFNTNKSNKGDKLKAMKEIKKDGETGEDAELPFGSIVRQFNYKDGAGRTKLSPLNIVGSVKKDEDGNDISYSGEEGGWGKWANSLSSQFLSKQPTSVARTQLAEMYERKRKDLDEILELENPVIKKKLLDSYADGVDSATTHLKAAGLPRTANHVILPINSLKDTEIYAPKYKNGEKVVLVRHPHAGPFEIPELIVNNRNKEANRLIKNAADAVGINAKVASRLSGADFDGDTVLVIPNPDNGANRIRNKKPLAGLVGFDPQKAHPPFEGMRTIDGGTWDAKLGKPVFPTDPKTGKPRRPNKKAKQLLMGDISNLITDMSLQGASDSELERAVRHSMVVIDAEKHSLDNRTSAKVNNIAQLKEKYQGRKDAGAATLISRSKKEVDVLERRPRPAAEGGNIDRATGQRRFVETGASYVNKKGDTIMKTQKVRLMDLTEDARTLVSRDGGTVMERVYADHANRLKSLANEARKVSYEAPSLVVNKSAKQAYALEVKSLAAKLDLAQRNAPRERMAQRLAAQLVKTKVEANPDLDKDGVKKVQAAAIREARERLGSKKPMINITEREWEAVQNGAVTNNLLKNVLDNADLDQVKQLATPRTGSQLPPAKIARAKQMVARGYDYAEIASMLGVPASTLHDAVNAP